MFDLISFVLGVYVQVHCYTTGIGVGHFVFRVLVVAGTCFWLGVIVRGPAVAFCAGRLHGFSLNQTVRSAGLGALECLIVLRDAGLAIVVIVGLGGCSRAVVLPGTRVSGGAMGGGCEEGSR